MSVFVPLKILEHCICHQRNQTQFYLLITMAQLAGYRPNSEELLKSKLSSEDEDYTFWLSNKTKKNKSVIIWKRSITTALKDFFRKKFEPVELHRSWAE